MGGMRDAILARSDAIPLYHQLYLSLRDEIYSGKRTLGSLLPTEHQLSEMFGVSRITARRALDELASQGLVARRRRIGTTVVFEAAMKPIEASLEHTVEALLAFGKGTVVEVLELGEVSASVEVAETLMLAPGAPVLRAVRLRKQNNETLGEIISHIPVTVARGKIDREALETRPLLSVVTDLGHKIVGGRQTVSALSADPTLASVLEIEPRAAILRVSRVVTGEGDAPLLHTIASYRADRYRMSMDLRGGALSLGESAG